MISDIDLIVLTIAAFISSIFGGITGGGMAGFIMTPLSIALGLTPAQAVANGKINGLNAAIGSLSGLQSKISWLIIKKSMPFGMMAILIGLFVPNVITKLDSEFYKITLGIIILLMIPFVIKKKVGLKARKVGFVSKIIGYGAVGISMFMLGIFSGGLGTLINLSFMGLFGMDALQANIVKRLSQVFLNVTVTLGLIGSGLFVWKVLIVTVPTILLGTYIGGKMATKRGNKFIMDITIIFMFVAGSFLIFG